MPDWVYTAPFHSITQTEEELSVVTAQHDTIPQGAEVSSDWRIIKVMGPLDFSLTGIIAGIADCLKHAAIPIFTISTFNTDYILVKQEYFDRAATALRKAGYNFIS